MKDQKVGGERASRRRFTDVIHSIRFRLTAWFVVILALILVVFSAFVYYRQAQAIYTNAETRLNLRLRDLDLLVRRFGVYENNGLERLPAATITSNIPLQANEVVIVTDAFDGKVTSWGPVEASISTQLANLASRWQSGSIYPVALDTGKTDVERYLFTVSPVAYENHVLGWIVLGQAVDPDRQLNRLLITLIFSGLATLAIALLGGFWLASRALKPVQEITHTAQEIGGSDLSRRLDIRSRDEIGELAATFNQMLERLEAAFNRQRQFTADASHELRTPLTIIGLEANRALAARRNELEYQQSLQMIRSENEFMTRLVNELLTLARIDSGKAQVQMDVVDLSGLALEVVERLSPLAAQRRVQLQAGSLPEVYVQGDHQYLQQMVGNLVENAIKYTAGTENGRVIVETALADGQESADGQAGTQAYLLVTDNGPGIDPEHLPHIFDRFYRADQARSHNLEEEPGGHDIAGVGLGLSIVKWIVEIHAGEIEVISEPGKGTRVQVSLPAVIQPGP